MTEVKKGIGKVKVGLAICVILVAILAISNVWLYTTTDSLQNQVSNLETDKDNLQSQINALQTDKSTLEGQVDNLETEKNQLQAWLDGNKTLIQTTTDERDQLEEWLGGNVTDYESEIERLDSQIATLNSQINSLDAQITNLQSEIDSLEAPQLHRVEVYWSDNHPLIGSPWIDISGSIFNAGSQTAYSVVYTVRIYDEYDTLLKTEEIHLGNIGGKSYETFDVDISYSGDADYVTTTLSYD